VLCKTLLSVPCSCFSSEEAAASAPELYRHGSQARYAPTLEGQYIIKNLVLVSAAMVIGAAVRGARSGQE
jgi:hypothetical protein